MRYLKTPRRNARFADVVLRKNYCSLCWQAETKAQGAAWVTASSPARLLAMLLSFEIPNETKQPLIAKCEKLIQEANQHG